MLGLQQVSLFSVCYTASPHSVYTSVSQCSRRVGRCLFHCQLPPAAAASQLPLPSHTTVYVWAAALSNGQQQQQQNMFFPLGSENWADRVPTVRLQVII